VAIVRSLNHLRAIGPHQIYAVGNGVIRSAHAPIVAIGQVRFAPSIGAVCPGQGSLSRLVSLSAWYSA
jgi:hypothetical protein